MLNEDLPPIRHFIVIAFPKCVCVCMCYVERSTTGLSRRGKTASYLNPGGGVGV